MNEAEARQVLRVDASASPSQLRSAYRSMVKLWHPDRFTSDPVASRDAMERTQRINAAYRFLQRNVSDRIQGEADAASSPMPWSGNPIRKQVLRARLVTLSASAILIVGISWIIQKLVLGL